jgi:arabinose-5-phosphate isomerase
MKEAIEEMTGKGFGITTVVDAAGRLVGILTDGDLRRQQLAHGAGLLDRRAAECMTREPKVIGAEELATSALALMEGRITSLVIVDAAGRPAGVIRLHDILLAKIV